MYILIICLNSAGCSRYLILSRRLRYWGWNRRACAKNCGCNRNTDPYQLPSCVGTVTLVHLPPRPTFRTDVLWSQPSATSEIAPPIWYLLIFLWVFWSPAFMSTVQGPYKTSRPTYPLLCWVRVIANARNRVIQYIDNGGRHLTDMILKNCVKQNFRYVPTL